MTRPLHASSKPLTVAAIASSVRSQRRPRCLRTIGKSKAIVRPGNQCGVLQTLLRKLLVATKHWHECERGSRRHLAETIKSYLLQEKQGSAKLLSWTRLHGVSLRMAAFG